MVTAELTSTFDILPAIDLRGGRVVRLEQGDFDRETAFSDDPVAIAARFAESGARWLHVVDLDGARTGAPVHGDVIARIVRTVGAQVAVEVAGGLRSSDAVRTVLGSGAARAVVGTAALRDHEFARRLVDDHGPDRVAVAIDVRDGRAVGQAWTADAEGVDAVDAIGRLADAGIATFEVTAIERDGTGGGPDVGLYERLDRLGRGSIVASAGIASVADVTAVRALGCTGAIIGRALYDGRLSLAHALDAARSTEPLPVRRATDGEYLGAVRPDGDGRCTALTVFGGTLGRASTIREARAIIEADGLRSLARRWFHRPRGTGTWQVVVIQEAWPGRVRAVVGIYPLAGAPTLTITAQDLAAGDELTLDPPPEAGLDQFRS